MTDVINFTKQAFTWTVVALTVAWSVGISALIAPVAANAAACGAVEAGDVVKFGSESAVYLVDGDMGLRSFTSPGQLFSWGYSYDDIVPQAMSCKSEFNSLTSPAGRGLSYGLLTSTFGDGAVYLLALDGSAYQLQSPADAMTLFGEDWESKIQLFSSLEGPNYPAIVAGPGPLDVDNLPNEVLISYNDGLWIHRDGAVYPIEGDVSERLANSAIMGTDEMIGGLTVMEDTTPAADVLNPLRGLDGAGDDTGDDSSDEVADGELTVSLAATTPGTGNVPINVDNVAFTKLVFTAGSDADVQVNSVKIIRNGLGQTGDFTSVTLYDGATKLGSSRTSWSSDNVMSYNIPNGWIIPAGTSKTLTIKAKLDTAGTYNALGVSEVVTSDSEVSGTPVSGNQLTGVDVTVGGVTITGRGTTSQTKNIGDSDVNFAKFRLEVSSVEDGQLEVVRLKNKGTASDSDIDNVVLYHSNEIIAGPVSMESDYISFVLDAPLSLEKSDTVDFRVVGDILNGDTNTVEFVLDDTTDLVVIGDEYGTNMTVTSTDFDAAVDSGTTATTIDGAELNISFSSTPMETMDDVNNISFGELTLGAGSTDIKITNLILTMVENDGDSDATNNKDVDELELVDLADGSLYSGAESTGSDSNATDETWTYTDEIYLVAGESRTFNVRGDLPDGIGDLDSYKIQISSMSTAVTAETVPEGDTVDNFSVGSINGKLVTVEQPALTVKSTNMNNATPVVNDLDVVLFKGTLEANSVDAIDVERMRFEGANATAGNTTTVATNMDVDNWTQIGLYTWDSSAGEWVQQQLISTNLTDGELDFDTLDFAVPAGETVSYAIMGDVASTLTGNDTVHLQLDTITGRDSEADTVVTKDSAGTAIANNAELEIVYSVSLQSQGTLYVSMRNADTGYNKDRVLLAGDGAWVGKLRMRAESETIEVLDLKLTNTSADDEDSVDSVCLYSAESAVEANLVGCTTLDSNDVAYFQNLNADVEVGTHDWFIYVNSNEMGNGASQIADSKDVIQFKLTTSTVTNLKARGVESQLDLSYGNFNGTCAAGEICFDNDLDGSFDEAADTETASTKSFYVAGSRISSVQMVSSYGGESVDSQITGTGEYTFAIVAITNESNNNTDSVGNPLKLALEELRFDMDKYNTTTLSSATVERINGVTGEVALTVTASTTAIGSTYDDWTLATATSTLGADADISAGDTAYFVVKATVSALDATTGVVDWVRISLDDISGTAGGDDSDNNIDWFDGYASESEANDFEYLLLDTTSISGTKVAENL